MVEAAKDSTIPERKTEAGVEVPMAGSCPRPGCLRKCELGRVQKDKEKHQRRMRDARLPLHQSVVEDPSIGSEVIGRNRFVRHLEGSHRSILEC